MTDHVNRTFKKVVQQARRTVGARSVLIVREHDNGPRTPLAAFFNARLIVDTPVAAVQASPPHHQGPGTEHPHTFV